MQEKAFGQYFSLEHNNVQSYSITYTTDRIFQTPAFMGEIVKLTFTQNEYGTINSIEFVVRGSIGNYQKKQITYTYTDQDQKSKYIYYMYSKKQQQQNKKMYAYGNATDIIGFMREDGFLILDTAYQNLRIYMGLSLNHNADEYEQLYNFQFDGIQSFITEFNSAYLNLKIYNRNYSIKYLECTTILDSFFDDIKVHPRILFFNIPIIEIRHWELIVSVSNFKLITNIQDSVGCVLYYILQ